MRDFDQEREKTREGRDLEFTVGGETFHIVAFVQPEALDAFQPTNRPEGKSVLDVYDEWIVSMLVDEDKPKWKKVREESTPPLELHTIETITFWLVEQATGRPTVRPSSLRSGPSQSGAGSQGSSSSRVHAA